MSETMAMTRRPMTPLAWIAIVISVAVAAALWFAQFDVRFGHPFIDLKGMPESMSDTVGPILAWVLLLGVPATIVLNIFAGLPGGASRISAVVGGVLVAAPGVYLAVIFLHESLAVVA